MSEIIIYQGRVECSVDIHWFQACIGGALDWILQYRNNNFSVPVKDILTYPLCKTFRDNLCAC